jgi:hypothetical protein
MPWLKGKLAGERTIGRLVAGQLTIWPAIFVAFPRDFGRDLAIAVFQYCAVYLFCYFVCVWLFKDKLLNTQNV